MVIVAGVEGFKVVGTAVDGLDVVGTAVEGFKVVGMAVEGLEVVGAAVEGFMVIVAGVDGFKVVGTAVVITFDVVEAVGGGTVEVQFGGMVSPASESKKNPNKKITRRKTILKNSKRK
uniref:Uncharacterized protein n=1 Tax=Panagrolaimus sp. JU765 TaxID=591449 RepID=A0AC34QI91_9BILA